MTQAADQARAVFTDIILEDFKDEPLYAAQVAEHRQNLGVTQTEAPAPAPVASAAQTVEVEHVAATEAEAPALETPVAAPPVTSIPEFNLASPELPDDLREFLDAPDFEAEAEAELATTQVDETNEFEDEYANEETTAEKKRRVAVEKENQWLKQRLADTNRDKWREEANKYFPYASHVLDGLTATSRRQFLRDAQKAHEAMKPHLETYLKAATTAISTERDQVVTSAKQEVYAAYGTPTVDPASAASNDTEFQQQIEKSRRDAPNLTEHFRTLIKAADASAKKP